MGKNDLKIGRIYTHMTTGVTAREEEDTRIDDIGPRGH